MRFAEATAVRACETTGAVTVLLLAGITVVVAVLTGRAAGLLQGLALVGADAVVALETDVRATPGHRHRDTGRGGRFPVEDQVADGDLATGDGAHLHELLLDAQPVEAVREVTDGFVVGEVGLADPALGAFALHD